MFGNMFQDEQKKDHTVHDESKNTNFKDFFGSFTNNKIIFLIVIVALCVFGASLQNGFTNDDNAQIVKNVAIHSLNNVGYLFGGSSIFYNGGGSTGIYYRPFSSITFATLYAFGGPNPGIFHFYQLFLHIFNTILLFFIFKRFIRILPALFVALFFLVHPINNESVFYISATQEVLFTFYGLLAIYLFLKIKDNKKYYFIPFLLLASLFSKEAGILYLLVLIFYAFLFTKKETLKIMTFGGLSFLLFLIFKLPAVGFISKSSGAPFAQLPLFERVIQIPAIIFFYLKTFFFPLQLSSSYQWTKYGINDFETYILPIAVIMLFLLCLFLLGRYFYQYNSQKYFKLYLFFVGWFFIGMSLHVQIIPLDATVAERWFYFPIIGLLGIGGLLLDKFHESKIRQYIYFIVIAIIVFFSVITYSRGLDWKDQYTLTTHDLQVSKNDYILENLLSSQYLQMNQLDKAEYYAKKSIEHHPYVINYINLGTTYVMKKDYKNAKEAFTKALKFGDYYMTYENLAVLAVSYGDPQENISFINVALAKFPQSAKLWTCLAVIQYENKLIEDAKTSITKAYSLNPNNEVLYIYTKIMNNEPLNLNYKVDK